jgi:hypothetical protein
MNPHYGISPLLVKHSPCFISNFQLDDTLKMSEYLSDLIDRINNSQYPASLLLGAAIVGLFSVIKLLRWILTPSKRHNLPIFRVTSPDVVGVLEEAHKKVRSCSFQSSEKTFLMFSVRGKSIPSCSARDGYGRSPIV